MTERLLTLQMAAVLNIGGMLHRYVIQSDSNVFPRSLLSRPIMKNSYCSDATHE